MNPSLPKDGLPRWLSGKESACQLRGHGFDPWWGKMPWSRKRFTPVFLPGKSHWQRDPAGYGPWGGKRVRQDVATKQQHGYLRGESGLQLTALAFPCGNHVYLHWDSANFTPCFLCLFTNHFNLLPVHTSCFCLWAFPSPFALPQFPALEETSFI